MQSMNSAVKQAVTGRNPGATRLVTLPVLMLLGLLLLAACNPRGTSSQIEYFSATPLADGQGTWSLEWRVSGSEATLDGIPVPPHASEVKTVATATTFTLRTGASSRSLTLAPADALAVSAPDVIHPGMAGLQFTAVVTASGSDEQPGQQVSWASSDDALLSIDATSGIAAATATGTVTVTAISAQYPDLSAQLTIELTEAAAPVINSFTLDGDSTGLEAGSHVTVSWATAEAVSVRLIEVVTGETERTATELDAAAGSVGIDLPTDKELVNYRLVASNIAGAEVSKLLWSEPLSLPGWVCSDPEDVIGIPDPVLHEAVWKIYRNTDLDPGDDVLRCGMVQQGFTPVPYPDDEYGLMERHNAIIINRCDQTVDPVVSSLEGIQHLRTLLRLELMCNDITDISRLSGLHSLQELNLDRNSVSDLSPLAGLTGLQVIGLYQNEVADLSPLAGLSQLRVLYLSENRIHDLTPLAGLDQLEHLWLYMNCTDLTGEVPTGCLQDLTGVGSLSSLRSLVVHDNEISDLSPLGSGLANLELLTLTNNQVQDLTPLAGFPSLSTLRAENNLISDLGPLVTNSAFPSAAEPFWWERSEPGFSEYPPYFVSMPIGRGRYDSHLSLHENCLDADSFTDLQVLLDRGVTVSGAAEFQLQKPGCLGGLSSQQLREVRFDSPDLLREDSRWYQIR